MVCGFISLILFGLEMPALKLEQCQHSKVDCHAYVSTWLEKLPTSQFVWDDATESFVSVELVGVNNTTCHVLPKSKPRKDI